jgi:hypothetical protein
MTTRVAVIALIGLVAAACLGGLASTRHDARTATAAWHGSFSPKQWTMLERRLDRMKLDGSSARVVTAGDRLALIAVRRGSGSTCYVAATPANVDRPICRLMKPLTVFAVPGVFQDGARTTELVGLASPGVASVVAHHGGRGEGQPLLPAAAGYVFGGEFRGAAVKLVAFDAHGKRVAVDLAAPVRR